MPPIVSSIEIAPPPGPGLLVRHRPLAVRRVAGRRGERTHGRRWYARRRLTVHHNAPDRWRRADDDPGDNGDSSPQELGRARCRRTDQSTRRHHRRTFQRQGTVACDIRARLRRARDRRPARAHGPPDGCEAGAEKLPEPEEAARERRLTPRPWQRASRLPRSPVQPHQSAARERQKLLQVMLPEYPDQPGAGPDPGPRGGPDRRVRDPTHLAGGKGARTGPRSRSS